MKGENRITTAALGGLAFWQTYSSTREKAHSSLVSSIMAGAPAWNLMGGLYGKPADGGQDAVLSDVSAASDHAGLVDRLRKANLFASLHPADEASPAVGPALRAIEAVGRIDLAASLVLLSHSFGAGRIIRSFGDQDQRATWEEALRSGRKIGAYALSEPEAGSDAAGVATTVVPQGRHFVLNGKKSFVTNAVGADLFLVFALGAGEDEETRARLSVFLVRGGVKGVIREEAGSDPILARAGIMTVRFEDVRLERSDLVGKPGDGYRIAQAILDGVRLGAASAALGAASATLDGTIEGLRGRKQFGKSHTEFGMVQDRIGRARGEIFAARSLVGVAAHLADQGREIAVEAALARLGAVEGAYRAVDSLLHVAGAWGLAGPVSPAAVLAGLATFRFVGGADDVLKIFVTLHGGKSVAEFMLNNRKARRGASWLDSVVKAWWRGARLDYGRLHGPKVAPGLKKSKRLLEDAMTLLADRVFKLFHYAGAEAIEYQIEIKRIAEMTVEVFTLLSMILHADAVLAGRVPGVATRCDAARCGAESRSTEEALAAVEVHSARAWKRLIRHSSRFFLSDDATIVKLSGLESNSSSSS